MIDNQVGAMRTWVAEKQCRPAGHGLRVRYARSLQLLHQRVHSGHANANVAVTAAMLRAARQGVLQQGNTERQPFEYLPSVTSEWAQ